MDPADVVLRFLESVGRPDEARYYLARFRAEPREQFAVISIEANVARDALEAVVLDLRFLAAVGLVPVVVLGLFEAASAFRYGARIQRRLARESTAAVLLTADDPALCDKITNAARAGIVPLVVFGPRAGSRPDERVSQLGAVVAALKTRKVIFLHRRGGLRHDGALVPVLALDPEATAPPASVRSSSRKQQLIVAQARRLLLDLAPHELFVALTSPLNLFRELFTVKGAGTLIKRRPRILRFDGWQGVDRERLLHLLEASFGGPAAPAMFERPVARVYVEAQYRGAAIVRDTPLGPYLTKFAVAPDAQGEGLGRDLWDVVIADRPTVFWRARARNPIVGWYASVCDGLVRFPEWHVYWRGLETRFLASAIEYALAQPVDIGAAAGSAKDVEPAQDRKQGAEA
jgi:ribosomal protein S18 acetylase RimI-like enzyme